MVYLHSDLVVVCALVLVMVQCCSYIDSREGKFVNWHFPSVLMSAFFRKGKKTTCSSPPHIRQRIVSQEQDELRQRRRWFLLSGGAYAWMVFFFFRRNSTQGYVPWYVLLPALVTGMHAYNESIGSSTEHMQGSVSWAGLACTSQARMCRPFSGKYPAKLSDTLGIIYCHWGHCHLFVLNSKLHTCIIRYPCLGWFVDVFPHFALVPD